MSSINNIKCVLRLWENIPFGKETILIPKKYHRVPKSFISKQEAKSDFNVAFQLTSSPMIIISSTYRERRIWPIDMHFRKNVGSWWLGRKPREVCTLENFVNQAQGVCLRSYKAFLSF